MLGGGQQRHYPHHNKCKKGGSHDSVGAVDPGTGTCVTALRLILRCRAQSRGQFRVALARLQPEWLRSPSGFSRRRALPQR